MLHKRVKRTGQEARRSMEQKENQKQEMVGCKELYCAVWQAGLASRVVRAEGELFHHARPWSKPRSQHRDGLFISITAGPRQ